MTVASAATGALGLAVLRRAAGIDVVVIADRLPDLTAQQVIAEIRATPRVGEAPILLLSDDAATAEEIYSDSVEGVLAGPDAAAVTAAMSTTLNADRARADELSAQAAGLLAVAPAAAGMTPPDSCLSGGDPSIPTPRLWPPTSSRWRTSTLRAAARSHPAQRGPQSHQALAEAARGSPRRCP